MCFEQEKGSKGLIVYTFHHDSMSFFVKGHAMLLRGTKSRAAALLLVPIVHLRMSSLYLLLIRVWLRRIYTREEYHTYLKLR